MPRHARFVIPGVPHHITQRGNHRGPIFFSSGDQEAYLLLLRHHATQRGIAILAYCLMPNHVHLVATPSAPDSLFCMLRDVHGQFAMRVNRMRELSGHLWQGRYFSSPLDANYLVNAVRYVELNPVRAGLVATAELYMWSSAATHCGLKSDPVLAAVRTVGVLAGIANWSRWLAEGVSDGAIDVLRRHGTQNLPCGSTEFLMQLEQVAGRRLDYRAWGQRTRVPDEAGRQKLEF
jgi:putative transposase